VQRTRIFPTGSYSSEKIRLGYEMPLSDIAELPSELRKGLALLDILLDAEVSRFKKNGDNQAVRA
jgi:hypothetical protein